MIRFIPAVAVLLLAAAPALAQTTPPQAPVRTTEPTTGPTPGSEAWLRLRGESYSAASDAEQDPAEVVATARLNAEIAARNEAAERAEIEATAAWQAEDDRWRAETARLETRRAQWEADAAAAEVAACQRTGRCPAPAPKD